MTDYIVEILVTDEDGYNEWLRVQIESGWQQAERGEMEEHNMQSILDEVLAEKQK